MANRFYTFDDSGKVLDLTQVALLEDHVTATAVTFSGGGGAYITHQLDVDDAEREFGLLVEQWKAVLSEVYHG
jgi:hypothetical protein